METAEGGSVGLKNVGCNGARGSGGIDHDHLRRLVKGDQGLLPDVKMCHVRLFDT